MVTTVTLVTLVTRYLAGSTAVVARAEIRDITANVRLH